ncbi:MAG: S8 family peptidase [Planctomycetes bacterium]|nr:S8 family peptidase [Planctomycetota bacterium]
MHPMLLLLGPGLLLAQSPDLRTRVGEPSLLPVAPSLSSVPPQVHDGLDGGEGNSAVLSELDDSVPLPKAAVWRADPQGDVLVTPASGDPYFLGFSGGELRPREDERIDPRLLAAVRGHWDDGRPTQETYAFAMFQRRITRERVAELEALGARVLGFHPHYCLKLALPAASIDLVAAHPAVRWLGVAAEAQQVHPDLAAGLTRARPGLALDVWISVFESDLGPDSTSTPLGRFTEAEPTGARELPATADAPARRWVSGGWQQRALERLGAEVGEFVPRLNAFRARVLPAVLAQVLQQDFVLFVEGIPEETSHHDESMPLIHADATRVYYDGGTPGGVVVGQIDTGLQNQHLGLAHIYGVGVDFTQPNPSAWSDVCGHGSHVAGTILGDGSVNASFAGVAPGLGWGFGGRFFNAKWLAPGANNKCVANTALSGPLAFLHTPYLDSFGNLTPMPQVVNNSWGGEGLYFGTELTPRSIDDEVYTYGQAYVFSAGNYGTAASTIGSGGSAKNAITVGSVTSFVDPVQGLPGEFAQSSSRGPTGDMRWKPNLNAPGVGIQSVNAATLNGYTQKSGTSMAAPHVTGVAAQILEHYPSMRYKPARLASLLMATASTKADEIHTSPSTVGTDHLNVYGAGRVDAYRAHWNTDQLQWTNWGFDQDDSGYQWGEFEVLPGAKRLILAFHYVEPMASSGASAALIDDYDLYLDRPPVDTSAGNTGEYTAHQSNVNNTELRIIEDPAPGTWRWKSFPEDVPSNDTVHASVTISVIYGDPTPGLTLTVSADDETVKPFEHVNVDAEVSNPGCVASAVSVTATIDPLVYLWESTTTLLDGAVTNLMGNETGGLGVVLGDILHDTQRTAGWSMQWGTEGVKTFAVNLRCDHSTGQTRQVNVTVDGTEPSQVSQLESTTHQMGEWSNDGHLGLAWTPATDNLSGLDGYGVTISEGAPELPPETKNLGPWSDYGTVLGTTDTGYYFNIRAVDKCGNWGAVKSRGPYRIDTLAPGLPGSPSSSTHVPHQTDCDGGFTFDWGAAVDQHSGIAGYRVILDNQPIAIPDASSHFQAQPGFSTQLTQGSWWVHVRAEDRAGNLGGTLNAGPYVIVVPPYTYCTGKVNSLGCTPAIQWLGTPRVTDTSGFTIQCTNLRNNKPGLLLYSSAGSAGTPFQGGTLCLSSPIRRTPGGTSGGSSAPVNDCSGVLSIDFLAFAHGTLGGTPAANLLLAGTPVWAQWWGRDPGFPAPDNTSLSNAMTFVMCQ